MSTSQRFYFIPTANKIDKYITVKTSRDLFLNQLKLDKISYNKDPFL